MASVPSAKSGPASDMPVPAGARRRRVKGRILDVAVAVEGDGPEGRHEARREERLAHASSRVPSERVIADSTALVACAP